MEKIEVVTNEPILSTKSPDTEFPFGPEPGRQFHINLIDSRFKAITDYVHKSLRLGKNDTLKHHLLKMRYLWCIGNYQGNLPTTPLNPTGFWKEFFLALNSTNPKLTMLDFVKNNKEMINQVWDEYQIFLNTRMCYYDKLVGRKDPWFQELLIKSILKYPQPYLEQAREEMINSDIAELFDYCINGPQNNLGVRPDKLYEKIQRLGLEIDKKYIKALADNLNQLPSLSKITNNKFKIGIKYTYIVQLIHDTLQVFKNNKVRVDINLAEKLVLATVLDTKYKKNYNIFTLLANYSNTKIDTDIILNYFSKLRKLQNE